jgi:hypothetical protein
VREERRRRSREEMLLLRARLYELHRQHPSRPASELANVLGQGVGERQVRKWIAESRAPVTGPVATRIDLVETNEGHDGAAAASSCIPLFTVVARVPSQALTLGIACECF